MIKVQIACIAAAFVGVLGMGCHLFLDDGIAHPTHVLTFFAALALAGLIGNAVAAFVRAAQEQNKQNRHDDP